MAHNPQSDSYSHSKKRQAYNACRKKEGYKRGGYNRARLNLTLA